MKALCRQPLKRRSRNLLYDLHNRFHRPTGNDLRRDRWDYCAVRRGSGPAAISPKPPVPEELERRRRLDLNGIGKLKAGQVTDVDGASIMYTYNVAGVQYSASQNIVGLQAFVPENAVSVIGPAGVKFDPRNPANSIVVCEEWSGLQRAKIRQA